MKRDGGAPILLKNAPGVDGTAGWIADRIIEVYRLAMDQPGLFERYLYVGAMRATAYLGLGCYGHLPARLEPLRAGLGAHGDDLV